MKGFAVIILFLASAALASCADDGKEKFTKEQRKMFTKWRKTHNKQFETLEKELAAMEIVLAVAKEIEEHNKLHKDGKISYSRRLNQHSHLNAEEKKKLFGVVIPEEEKDKPQPQKNSKRQTIQFVNPNDRNLWPTFPTPPESIDWSERGLVGPVEDQNPCGSCWAFSVAGVINAAWLKNNPNSYLASPQQLLDCTPNNGGCQGSSPVAAVDYAVKNGMTIEQEYPYVAYKSSCEYSKDDKYATARKYFATPTRGNSTWMKEVVGNVGPVGIMLCFDDQSLQDLYDGVYDNPNCCTDLTHAILVTGYGTDPTYGDYWIVKNQWGVNGWGVNGFGKIARGKNMCNIEFYALYVES